jgi:hypothetical protein
MNTQSQNTKTKRQHHYASQKHQWALIRSPKINKPTEQQKHNKQQAKIIKKTDTRRKEKVAIQG